MIRVSTAARYLPASDEVGGDGDHVFELARGRLGVAIVYVVGHGLRRHAFMGQLRIARDAVAHLRTTARPEHWSSSIAPWQAMPDYAMATAAYAVLEPDTGEVQIASAGSIPAARRGRPGGGRVVTITPSAPLEGVLLRPGAGARAGPGSGGDARHLTRTDSWSGPAPR